MRILSTLLFSTLASTVFSQSLPALSTSLLTPQPSSLSGGGISGGSGISTPTDSSSSTTSDGVEENHIDINTLLINTQDICIFQKMQQRERQAQEQKFRFEDQIVTSSGANGAAGNNSTSSSSSPSLTTSFDTPNQSAVLTPIGM